MVGVSPRGSSERLALDGGRTIRGDRGGHDASEHFTIAIDPRKPVHVEVSTEAGRAEATLAAPAGPLVEIALDLPVPARPEVAVRVTATGPYRVFHWFALQPD